ncbi:MAG TPA: histidinol-phosphate transaminase [Candidatus Udaeobacter sp.]|nr:histidinol-phosphate transaminase [Candidatus Udaeobacter sp.]
MTPSPSDPTPPPLHPRREVLDLAPYVPGKPARVVELEMGVAGAIKMASNENPLGPSPRVAEALAREIRDLNRYPEGTSLGLRLALAERHGVDPGQIVVGSGSNEIIELLAHVYLGPGDEAVLADPTFPMYYPAIRVTGADVKRVPCRELTHDLPAMAAAITSRTRMVFVCNPNNPTGTMVTADEVAAFMAAVPPHVLTVFDEAYHEYVIDPRYPKSQSYLAGGRPVAILRTFSKIYALAGLRVGYTITQPEIAAFLHRVRLPFNVTTLGQAAALASLDDPNQVPRSIQVNEAGKRYLGERLPALGVTVTPSHANFVLTRMPRPAGPIAVELERAGVIVRPMEAFRLPAEYARITVGTEPENERLVAALSAILGPQPAPAPPASSPIPA